MHDACPTDSSKCFARNSNCQVGKAVTVEVTGRDHPAEVFAPFSRFLHSGAVLMEYLTALCR